MSSNLESLLNRCIKAQSSTDLDMRKRAEDCVWEFLFGLAKKHLCRCNRGNRLHYDDPDVHDAASLASREVFNLIQAKQWPSVKDKARYATSLVCVRVKHRYIGILRERKRHLNRIVDLSSLDDWEEIANSLSDPVTEAVKERAQDILDAANTLPKKLQRPFLRLCQDGLIQEEVAKELKIDRSTVSRRIKRAIAEIQKLLLEPSHRKTDVL